MKTTRAIGICTALILSLLLVGAAHAYNNTNYTANANYTVPAGVTALLVETWGGGAGGNGGNGAAQWGGGGGGGAYAASFIQVIPGQQFNITVGTAGNAGPYAGLGTAGGGSNFSNTTNTYVYAAGGQPGGAITSGGLGATTASSIGTLKKYPGGNGANGGGTQPSGGGGGGAGDNSSGGNGTGATPGTGGNLYGGSGGAGRTSTGSGSAGTTNGGGGGGGGCSSGCGTQTGGAGARGEVRVWEYNATVAAVTANIYKESDLTIITVPINITISPTTGNGSDVTYTTSTGQYSVILEEGVYSFKFSGSNYTLRNYLVTVSSTGSVTVNAYLSTGTSTVTFQALNSQNGAQIESAILTMARSLNGTFTTVDSQYTDITGTAAFQYVSPARYRFTITKTGYEDLIFYLDPILLSSYQVKLTPDTAGAVNNTLDYAGLSVVLAPTTFYNDAENNVTFTIASPNGTLTQYAINITYPNGTYQSVDDAGINANGGTLQLSFNISGAGLSDRVNITYSYTTPNTGFREYDFTYTIQRSTSAGLFTYNQAHTYGMGAFERILITTIIVLLVAGSIAPFFGGTMAGLMGLFVLAYMTMIGFNPWWAALISILSGFALLTWVSGR